MKTKQKTLTVFQAIDKISAGEWVLVEDVKALFKNEHEGMVFFETEELLKFIKPYLRHNEKGLEAKASNEARIFIEWMGKQLRGER